MLFLFQRPHDHLQRAVRAAVAAHRAATLRQLLTDHGDKAFAQALGDLSGRVIADALSMLPEPGRSRVLQYLPREARARYQDVGGLQGGTAASPLLRMSALSLLAWRHSA